MTASKSKHVSFPNQREQCRLNKFTYEEKCTSCGILTLMCNYPFPDPKHRKGVCRASTCTDMRKTLAEDVAAISEPEVPVVVEMTKAPENVVENESTQAGDAVESDETEGDPKGAVRAQ